MAVSDRSPRNDSARTNREPQELRRKESLLGEPHIEPLTHYVERLRLQHGPLVPWFDPTEAGVEASILALLQTPGKKAALREEGGSGFISADNNDPTASNMWHLLRESGIDRERQYAAWNVIPWYVERGRVTPAILQTGHDAIQELLTLLPKLKVVLLLGDDAQGVWRAMAPRSAAAVLNAPHPSPLSLNTDASGERRRRLLDALVEAKELVGAGGR